MKLITVKEIGTEKKLESIGWTPLHTRILAHRIGDGGVNYYGHFVYDNKHMEEFIELLNFLNIKYWGPVRSDKYGTKKVIIPKKTFRDFASIFKLNHEVLIKNPVFLLETIAKLPEEHRLQAILAFIVDDGSCNRWMPTIFEDQNKEVFDRVKSIWNDIFPSTFRWYIQLTKKGTKVYHLDTNRVGILALAQSIEETVNKYGKYANLWWKQKDFDKRHNKSNF